MEEEQQQQQQQLPAQLRPDCPEAEQDCPAQPRHSTCSTEITGTRKTSAGDEINNREALKYERDQSNSNCTTNAEEKPNPDDDEGGGTPPPDGSPATEEEEQEENPAVTAMNAINNNASAAKGGLDNRAVSSRNARPVLEEDNCVSDVTTGRGNTGDREELESGGVDFNRNKQTSGDQESDCTGQPPRQDNDAPSDKLSQSDFSEQPPQNAHRNYNERGAHAMEQSQEVLLDVDGLSSGQSETNNAVNELGRSASDIAYQEQDLAEAEHQETIFGRGAKNETEGVACQQTSTVADAAPVMSDKHHDRTDVTDGASMTISHQHTQELNQYPSGEFSSHEQKSVGGEESANDEWTATVKDTTGVSVNKPLDSAARNDVNGECVHEGNQCQSATASSHCDNATPGPEDDAVSEDTTPAQQPRSAALDSVAASDGHESNDAREAMDLERAKPCASDGPVPVTQGSSCPPQQWDAYRGGTSGQDGWKDSDSSDLTGDEDEDEEEEMDPRVSENLEIMNQSCADVNRLENELDEARSQYRTTFQVSSLRMEELSARIKKNIQRARPYFELMVQAKEAQYEALRAARQYQTANSNYRAAKEMITLAEQTFLDRESLNTRHLNSAWQETLNHATAKVMESEREKTRSEAEHNKRAAIYAQLESRLQFLEKKFKRSIAKARPYFETKAELELKLQQLKQHVWDLQETISTRKMRYAEALRCLEMVSMEIHESRRKRNKMMLRYPREPGVGAESDSTTSSISDVNIERNIFSTTSYLDEDEEDLSDEGGDVFRPSSRGHSRENSRGTPPLVSRASSLRQNAKQHRRSASFGSAASGSVFSSSAGSAPQSPATESVTSQSGSESVNSPTDGFSRVPGFAAALKSAGGAPGSTCDQHSSLSALPMTLLNLAQGECEEPSSDAHSSPSAAKASPEERLIEDGGARSHSPSRNAAETETVRSGETASRDDERVEGDGSSCEDCPQGEQQNEGSRSSHAFVPHHSPEGVGNSDSQGCGFPASESHLPSVPDPLAPVLSRSSSMPKGLDSGKDLGVSPLAATPKSSTAAPQSVQGAPAALAKAGAGGGEVRKQPLRKAKPLQGFFVLNPMDLASSISSPSLRF